MLRCCYQQGAPEAKTDCGPELEQARQETTRLLFDQSANLLLVASQRRLQCIRSLRTLDRRFRTKDFSPLGETFESRQKDCLRSGLPDTNESLRVKQRLLEEFLSLYRAKETPFWGTPD